MIFNLGKHNSKGTTGMKLGKLILTVIIPIFLFAACSTDSGKKINTIPTPVDISDIPPTNGPTITPQEKNSSEEQGNGQATQTDASSASLGSETVTDALVQGDNPDSAPEEEPEGTTKEKSGYVVVLDPGHGGNYTGAIYFGNMEKDLTLSMANYVREYLLSNYEGIEVYLTRETDTALDGDLKIELEKRAIVAEEHDADFFISLHFNACEAHNLNGATVYASFREHVAEKSQGMAASILNQLVALGLKNNQVKTRKSADYHAEDGSDLDYYAVIRHSAARNIPGLIVEHCFMDNEKDHEFINSDEKLHELAKADAIGIAEYLGLASKQ